MVGHNSPDMFLRGCIVAFILFLLQYATSLNPFGPMHCPDVETQTKKVGFIGKAALLEAKCSVYCVSPTTLKGSLNNGIHRTLSNIY